MKEYIDKKIGHHFTIQQIRYSLQEKSPDLQRVSASTVHRVMTKQLDLSHKKLGKANPKTMNAEVYQKITDWMKLVEWFTNEGYKVVYLDEFSVNHKTVNLHRWTYRGVDGWKILSPQSFNMSFIVSFSWNQIEGLMGSKSSVCSDKFIWYLRWLLSRPCNKKYIEEGKIVFVLDNCSIHKSEKVRQFLNKIRVPAISIVAYSPFLNPAEHLIQWIKSKLKRDHDQGR